MIGALIRFGAMFDWITPLWTFFLDFINHPSVGYNIPVDGGWSAYAIRDLLKGSGIKIWGLTIYGSTITFRTRKAQAAYAQYLMDRAGILYRGGIRTEGYGNHGRVYNSRYNSSPHASRPSHVHSPSGHTSSWLDRIEQAIDRF